MLSQVHDSVGESAARIRVLYINPNSSLHFTKEGADFLRARGVPTDVRVDFYTAPSEGPASIDGEHDGVLSTALILRDLQLTSRDVSERSATISDEYDGVVIGCMSPHPLRGALRECLPPSKKLGTAPPVLGIFDAGVSTALLLGQAFSIVTTTAGWEPVFKEGLRALGVADSRIAGVRAAGLPVLGLHGDEAMSLLVKTSVEQVREKGADVVVLGCAGMAPLTHEIERRVKSEVAKQVPVIDGVQSAVETLVGFARMRLRQ